MRVTRSFVNRQELDDKLVQMAADDERSVSSFLRWLISEEWERRQRKSLTYGNGGLVVKDDPPANGEEGCATINNDEDFTD